MKKALSIALALAMCLGLAACSSNTQSSSNTTDQASQTSQSGAVSSSADASQPDASTSAGDSDLAYVQGKGTLVVGITDFEPMDYKDADGNWIGFDADMATAFAQSLGVDVEFVEIDWDNKVLELEAKTLDCVWNGMTLTDEVLSAMECSKAYCNNAQVVVTK